MTKYEQCPVCGKKGLYERITHDGMQHKTICRYCRSFWFEPYTNRQRIHTRILSKQNNIERVEK